MKKVLLILLFIYLSGCVATSMWFRTYREDVAYYEYQDTLNNIIVVTDNELDSIVLSDDEWLHTHRLRAIIFKK